MTIRFLSPEDPDAFVDWPASVEAPPEGFIICPQCKGYGGWNLSVNRYPLPDGLYDTAENRHLHVHFLAGCNNCWSNGFVPEAQGDHVHEYKSVETTQRGDNVWECQGCGDRVKVDSSD